jgi:hypothetical protein
MNRALALLFAIIVAIAAIATWLARSGRLPG